MANVLTRALGKWIGRERSLPTTGPAGMFRPGYQPRETSLGAWQRNLSCTMEDMTAFSAVYACVTIVSDDIAKLGLKLWRKLPKGGREEATGHPYWRLLQQPNDWQTPVEFVQQWLFSVLLTGNAFILLRRDGRGAVASMTVLDPCKVRLYLTDEGEAAYRLAEDPLNSVLAAEEFVPARDVMHDRMNTLFHPLMGVSPIVSAAASATAGNRILHQAESFFGSMSRPSGMLTTEARIDEATSKQMRAMWEANYGGAERAGRTAVMGAGLKWQPLTMSAQDSQLIEQLKFSVEDVARAYRVPGFMLGDLTKVSYRNAEQLTRIYYQGCLQYHLERMEWRLDASLDLASDIEAEFDMAALFRMESDVRAQTAEIWLRSGVLSINEARAREGLGPVDGGAVPRVQMQMQPIDAPPAAAAPALPAPAEEDEPDDKPEPEEEEEPAEEDEVERGIRGRMRLHV